MGGGEGRDRSPRAEQEWAGLAEKDSGMQRSPGEGAGGSAFCTAEAVVTGLLGLGSGPGSLWGARRGRSGIAMGAAVPSLLPTSEPRTGPTYLSASRSPSIFYIEGQVCRSKCNSGMQRSWSARSTTLLSQTSLVTHMEFQAAEASLKLLPDVRRWLSGWR